MPSKKMTPAAAAAEIGKSHHKVAHAQCVKMVKRYQTMRKAVAKAQAAGAPLPARFPELGISFSYNASAIRSLLKKPGVAGLRIYPAINDDNQLTMVLVAFDASGNNLTQTTMMKTNALRSGLGSGDDGTFDDGQINPPYTAPPTP